MDTDLFQILTLILLLGLLLTLFGVLQSLGAIRRTLEGRGEASPAREAVPSQTAAQPEPQREAEQPAWGSAAETSTTSPEPEQTRTGWPAPQEAAAEPEPQPAATATAPTAGASGGGARVLYGDEGLTTATPSEAALQTSEPEPEPRQEPEPEPAAEAQPAAASTATGSAAEDPQEQPFERDGRWWFRRGDELLVYEEQTGQWVAADEPAPAGGQPGTAGGATPAEGQVTTQQETVGSFWKCPSCGAVNGSTATSCRMCFTARP